ncbi:NUDIX hydrolase [candidate division WWE3 bacterium]|uniref:NUDIX hydrolase n=1 Tax=candidate division WWE3 bacterium TaxID=2053526 RepID=A0A955RSG0_UNCKA|nr:NUDIX hydrolase [candidate division WWE3 bacterium]
MMEVERPKPKKQIPNDAKKVFSGIIFDIYQWEVEGYDGRKEIHEVARRHVDTVDVLPITEDGKLILSKQQQPGLDPFIGFFGGRMIEGESPLETAKRELLEESGFEASTFELLDAQNPIEKVDWVCYVFLAKGLKLVAKQSLDPGERIEFLRVTFDDFMDLVSKPNFRNRDTALFLLQAQKDPARWNEVQAIFKP